jgi:D-lactate dehydrogenase (cytochrome)
LRVYGIPEYVMAARASFPSVQDAVSAVVGILQAGIPVARVELVDEPSMKQVNLFNDTNYKEQPTLFMEFHGNEAGLKQDVEFMKEIVSDYHCEGIEYETDQAALNQLWEARHNLAYAFIHGYPGKKMMTTDVCVPISDLGAAIDNARAALNKLDLPGGIVGHVGDGNFHALIMIDMNNPEEIRKSEEFNEVIVIDALERGGTCTGEHGVGVGKQKYQEREHGQALQVMERIKLALDPENLLNPNKLIKVKRELV